MDFPDCYLNALKSTAIYPMDGRHPSLLLLHQISNISSLSESQVPDIPPDLLRESFSRLPVRSLLRFRCVCKPWLKLISDPLLCQNQKIAIRHCNGLLYDLNLDSESDEISMAELHYPRRKKETGGCREEVEMPKFDIFGSCKGLLLIQHDIDFYLWNPSTRQCTKLFSYPRRKSYMEYESVLAGSGLCYDSVTDEYKAVLMAYRGYYFVADRGVAIVASLKSTRSTNVYFPYKLESGDSGTVVSERLHWVVNRDEDGTRFSTQEIVCFDPLVDEFVELSAPLPYYGERNVILGLGVLDGCLCVARCCCRDSGYDVPDYDQTPDIEVLIMKEYGVEESCTSLFVLSQFVGLYNFYGYKPYGCFVPLCLTKNGKVLIAVNGKQIVVYNPLEDSQKHITSPTNVFAYEESLVSPHSYGWGFGWRIEQEDAWNVVFYDSNRDRCGWLDCCDYHPSMEDISNWAEEDDYTPDSEEEDFLKRGGKRHRMRIRAKYLWKKVEEG